MKILKFSFFVENFKILDLKIEMISEFLENVQI